MIPNEIIDQILDKVDIVEVISGYIPLKKTGQNFKTNCPFHQEKTPSFIVSAGKQIYHCFGCGAGGNAIGFLMKYEKMDFIEAVRTLADKANIALPHTSISDRPKDPLADKLYEVNNMACDFYQNNLAAAECRDAYGYFLQRGIIDNTIKYFRLGFAQDSWQGLIGHCSAKGVELQLLEKAGLILQNSNTKNWYDRFRCRVVFPIFDIRNRILGFGARSLDNSLPKYINSPETYIYTKGKHLYGLNFSKEYIKKQNYVVIVEGYFDLILPYQNGIKNIVATLGTALTTEQVNVLKRFAKNIIMVYDSDKAGQEATLRSLDLLIEEDMNVRIALLPKGHDPDSLVRKEGGTGFMKVLKESKDFFEYKLGVLSARFRKDQPRGKARIVEEMLPTLSRIKNAVLKSSYLKKISEELSVDEESVRSELKKVRTYSARAYPIGDTVETEKKRAITTAEMMLLAIVLEDMTHITKLEELGFQNFKDKLLVGIFEKISQLHKSGKSTTPSHLISYFTDTEAERIISEATNLCQTIKDSSKALKDCLRHVRKDNLKEVLSVIQFKIRKAESNADTDGVNRLIAEYSELIKQSRV
ncbi:MAG: DNA primase [Omnitrophica bacterium RBG_13_46_9]|nr:MAG: DNA primase [Omnitrophica bacterium RBG_13_46_9]